MVISLSTRVPERIVGYPEVVARIGLLGLLPACPLLGDNPDKVLQVSWEGDHFNVVAQRECFERSINHSRARDMGSSGRSLKAPI